MKNFVLLLAAVAGLWSCKPDPQSKYLIPRKQFIEVLTDIYLVDGYYMINYNAFTRHKDTTNFYNDILKRHGYTKANFDSTLKYYSQRTKKFDAVYDEVITNLNKLQQEVYQLQLYSDTSRNLFKKKEVWHLPKDGEREMIPFKIAIKDTGLYTIVVQLRLYSDDQAEDPHLTAYFWYDDGTKNGHIEYFPFIKYKPTDRLVVLSTKKRNRNKKVTHIKGWILNHDNIDQHFKKHVDVQAIIVAKN
ncbi:MAG TPA: DUF4296 domain-containing protein [Bacteroidales bacterium]